jgi:hypothetical protein
VNPRARRLSLAAITVVAVAASGNALAHSYAGLYSWALQHRVSGWQARTWPAEIDVFLVVGELALYVAYLDGWPVRQRVWPWVTAVAGLAVSVTGNVGHVQAVTGSPVTMADRLTAAASPVAAFAGLMIGLLVLKMSRNLVPARPLAVVASDSPDDPLLEDAARIIEEAQASGERVSQRALAAQLRERGHRFSNAQLRRLADEAWTARDRRAA